MELNKKKLSIPVFFEKAEDNKDDRFIKVKIWLMHTGLNDNGTFFEKEVVDKAIPSLDYIPIVAYLEENKLGEEDCSNHRYDKVTGEYLGQAYGVILDKEHNNAHYEKKICDSGEEREYLVVDGYIWSMFEDCADIIFRDNIKSHSMELFDKDGYIDGYEDENNIFHFTKFSFRASCILGKDYQPAMENSVISLNYSTEDYFKNIGKVVYEKMMEYLEKGEKEKLEKSVNFELTIKSKIEEVQNILEEKESFVDRWGDSIARYRFVDIQGEEVIVLDRKDNHRYYGLPITFDGDNILINFDDKKRKKISYSDIQDGENVEETNTLEKEIVQFEEKIDSVVAEKDKQIEELTNENEDLKAKILELEEENKILVEEKDKIEKELQELKEEDENDKKETEFLKYEEYLGETDSYIELKENSSNYCFAEIESKLALMYATKMLSVQKTNFSKVDLTEEKDLIIETKYGNIIKR